MNQETIDINDIVKIEQMPIVFEQLEKIGTLIDERTKDLDTLECTEENKQEVKKRRTEINNTLKVLEDKRKEIKTKLLEPYNVFEEKYENECKTKLQNASELLKGKIDTIESQQLLEKENELKEFAYQHIEANNLSQLIDFDSIGLNITLSASMKSLKEQVLDFINKIVGDLKLIEMEEYRDEISIEYIQTLDFVNAKTKVIERHKQLELLKQQQEEKLEQEKQEEEIIGKVEEIVEEVKPPVEILESDEVIKVSFTLTGTKEQIKKVKDLIVELGIEYE